VTSAVTYSGYEDTDSYNATGDGVACFIVRVISGHFSKAVCQKI
jgi:hypothetical protein